MAPSQNSASHTKTQTRTTTSSTITTTQSHSLSKTRPLSSPHHTTAPSLPPPLVLPSRQGSASALKQQPAASTTTSPLLVEESSTGRFAPSFLDTTNNHPESPATETFGRQSSFTFNRRQSTLSPSTSSSTKQSRPVLFTLAALARDKTTSAFASLTDSSIRPQSSSGSLYLSAQSSPTTLSSRASSFSLSTDSKASSREQFGSASSASTSALPSSHLISQTQHASSSRRRSLLESNPPSQDRDTAADNSPPTTSPSRARFNNKMHQTSSRLLRMTMDDRPFARDCNDLYATLVVSLPLAPHRVRLSRVDYSFLSEEAIGNLGSLKFSQSNRMPDPKDPARIVTTTTTTTFSMAREMARSVCQRFLDARFIESADGKQAKEYTTKGSVWQLTPKGIHVLERFVAKNGIAHKHIAELVNSPRNTMQLVILERDWQTDKPSLDRSTVEVIFRRFIGQNGPNVKNSTSSADSDSLSEYKDGLAGVRMAQDRKVGNPPRTVHQTFTGKAATDWLMDCCTTVDKRETADIAACFVEHELIWCVQSDRAYLSQFSEREAPRFQPTKQAIYQVSQRGKDVMSMVSRERTSESEGTGSTVSRAAVSRDSNTQKLDKILSDAALRLLFRENLRDTHCEENLSFFLDVDEFLRSCRAAIKANSPSRSRSSSSSSQNSLDLVKEVMASAYGIYNAFLAPGSPCELNIDHLLRNQLATRMTKSVGQDAAMIESLREVTKLFEEAQISVFKLMASDSVPKFMKNTKYEHTLKNYDFDSIAIRSHPNIPERSISRSNASSSTR